MGFVKFDTAQARDICLNLVKENKFIFSKYNSIASKNVFVFINFFRENIWQGPLIFQPYTNFNQSEQQIYK